MIRFLSSRVYYGWVVVFACFGTTMILGETFFSFGVFLKPLSEEFGWSRALFSSAYSAFMVSYGVSSFVLGRLADRYGPRYMLLASAIMVGGGLALASLATGINQMRLFFAIVGLGAGGTLTVPASTALRWFTGRRQGLALGIVSAGVGVGAMVFAPLINYLIENYDWRQAFLVAGIISFALVFLCLLFIVETPQKLGLAGEGRQDSSPQTSPQEWTGQEAMRTGPLWLVIAMACIGGFAFNGISVHLVAYAIDAGISSAVAAAAQGLIGGFSILGRIGGGILAQKKGWGFQMTIAFVGTTAAAASLFFPGPPLVLYLFSLVFGACHGMRMTAQTGLMATLFGTRSAGELIGLLNAVSTILGAFGPVFAGAFFDRTESYLPAFSFFIFLYLAAIVMALRLKPPRGAGVGRLEGS
ncbi:MAG: MFS transporter [Chloroflexi bacterium]|nr:MFS transporter [Chloroflexota bacterium]